MQLDLLNEILENQFISNFASLLPKSGNSVNKTHECDSEIIDIGLPECYLALTTDTIAEEIDTGLYSDPYLIGWMAIIVNLSDLAAVGAKPIGLLLNVSFPSDLQNDQQMKIAKGIKDACDYYNCGILGGDTNSDKLSIGATAVGTVKKDNLLKRTGLKNKDIIYSTGYGGMGSAIAVAGFLNLPGSEKIPFKPIARIKEAQIISKYANCCMDTSDGFITTLDQLSRLNSMSLHIEDINSIVHPHIKQIAQNLNFPVSAMLAGIHGEFELIFSVSQEKENEFLLDMKNSSYNVVKIGYSNDGNSFGIYSDNILIDSTNIRNAWLNTNSIKDYIDKLAFLMNKI